MGLFKKKEMIENPDVKVITDAIANVKGEIIVVEAWLFASCSQYTVKDFLRICEMKNIVRINRGNYYANDYVFYAFDPQNGVAICTVIPKQKEKVN